MCGAELEDTFFLELSWLYLPSPNCSHPALPKHEFSILSARGLVREVSVLPVLGALTDRRCFSKPCSQLWHFGAGLLAQDWQWQQEQSIVSALLGFCLEDTQSVLPVHAERMSSKERSLASSLPLHSL